jgi:hypothetical protein
VESAGARLRHERVVDAAPSFRIACEEPALHQRQDVPESGVLRALGELGILGRRELAFEAIQHAIEDQALPVVDSDAPRPLPEACLGQDRAQQALGAVDRASQTPQEPAHPRGDVHRPRLRQLQDLVVILALLPDLGRQAVEPLRATLRAREGHVGDGARDAAVAVLERMEGHEPEMGLRGLQHRIDTGRRLEPLQEGAHLGVEPLRPRRLEVDALPAYRSGNHLHGPLAVVVPRSRDDPGHAAAPGGKQRRVPGKEAFGGQRLVEPARGVEHHLDDPLDITVRRLQDADVHTQPPGDRRANLLGVELLPLDLAAFDHVAGQRLEDCLLPKVEPERLHVPDESALPVADGGQKGRELVLVPVEPGPVRKPMDIHSPRLLRRLWRRFAAESKDGATSFYCKHNHGTGFVPRSVCKVSDSCVT